MGGKRTEVLYEDEIIQCYTDNRPGIHFNVTDAEEKSYEQIY